MKSLLVVGLIIVLSVNLVEAKNGFTIGEIRSRILKRLGIPEETNTTEIIRRWIPLDCFSGSGFLVSSNESKAEPININVCKRSFAWIEETEIEENETESLWEEVREKLNASQEIWFGKMTVGTTREKCYYYLIGVETDDKIDFDVIPKHCTANIEIEEWTTSEMEITRKEYEHIEIWEGSLDLETTIYEGEWDVTAHTERHLLAWPKPIKINITRSEPVQVEIGKPVDVEGVKVRPIKIEKPKLFGVIPIPWGRHKVTLQVQKDGNITVEEVESGSVIIVKNLPLRVRVRQGAVDISPD